MKQGQERSSFEQGGSAAGESAASRARNVVENARERVTAVADRYELQERVAAHPFRALGIALGAGYIIGGGLFTPFTARVVFSGVRLGLRLAALPVIRNELTTLFGEQTQDYFAEERREQ
jgi:hypothetical protein